jgi:hypothetical protein
MVRIMHDLAPGLTANVNAMINKMLPASNGDPSVKRGIEVARTANSRVLDLVMQSASKTHQLSGQTLIADRLPINPS